MRFGKFLTALATAALFGLPAIAGESDTPCQLERIGRLDLSPATEPDYIIVSGDKCEANSFNVIIRTAGGTEIYQDEIHHRDIGTSGLAPDEHFARAAETIIQGGGGGGYLPPPERLELDYDLYIDLENYERLRQLQTPAFRLPENYYYGYVYIVYDESVGRAVRAIGIGG